MENPFASERLIYRAMEDTDDDFVHSIQSDPIGFGNSSFGVMKPQRRKDTVEGYAKGIKEQAFLGVIICLPSAPAVLGEDGTTVTTPARSEVPIGVVELSPSKPSWSHHRESYISIDVAPGHRGKGYGTEALAWVANWAFQIAGLHRLTIETFGYNEGACRLYERVGFVPEGRKRKAVWFNGAWHDFVTFGMLEDEWRDRERAKGRTF
jgi:RimJ/RimL family protein N-acetyltransferase